MGALGLLVGGASERARLNLARIHPLVEEVHHLALAGTLHARDHDQHGETPAFLELVLGLEQRLSELGLLAPVYRLADVVIELG